MIEASGTGYVITTPEGGGLLTIRVENSAQVTAIDHALRGIVQGDGAFFPRDYEALVRELHSMLVRGPYEVQREPLPESRVRYQLDQASHVEAGLPFKLEEIAGENYKTFLSMVSERALGYESPIEEVEIFGYCGRDELHLLVKLLPDVT